MADLSRFNAKTLAEFDREIQELKSEYQSLESQTQEEFRKWLERLTSIVAEQPAGIPISVLCRTDRLDTDQQGEIVYDGVVHLFPKAMLLAITAWDDGENFTPESFVQIM